jgi:hypothetical protein
VPHSATRADSVRRAWASKTPEQRKAGTQKARLTHAVNEIRRQVRESRTAQGLPEHVTAEQFLDELAAEVLGGGQDAG